MEYKCTRFGCKKPAEYAVAWDTGGGSFWCREHTSEILTSKSRRHHKPSISMRLKGITDVTDSDVIAIVKIDNLPAWFVG